ncbi:DUF2752 domain-containing protein [Epilithonimonas arachidiradicis]|uniref:Uncharacterized protein DUF2752 n=1 Tax=Epilithonimonas arachidiradicis TaxID=1617282 RepID=A0A420DCN2_9FLAO|nr:uncharacterized protein DUF2752 [Epilithonimonas arachidiradicis]GGG52993.1 hypothetical protein GCM10007332_13330 [Epilithonimonas arachidiradicis]
MIKTIYKNQELKSAIRIVWQISAIISILILLLLFLIDDDKLLSISPTCEYQKVGKECLLCGSTRAFIEIKHFNLETAFHLNPFSIFIFGLLILNSILFLNY